MEAIEPGIENLSAARAKALMDQLLSKGIDPFPEKSETERIQNRGVKNRS
jgi:hypothetical protein